MNEKEFMRTFFVEGWKDRLFVIWKVLTGRVVSILFYIPKKEIYKKIAIALVVVLSVCVGNVFASDDYITKETYGSTTYFTDQDGRSAVGQESGGIYTLYDNGSGLVDSGRVTVDD